jgi:UDP-N-acetyl-D-mannosaminuronate dehydrogenase
VSAVTDTSAPISTVGIIGLGYVGLPLAVAFAEAGLHCDGALEATIDAGHLREL